MELIVKNRKSTYHTHDSVSIKKSMERVYACTCEGEERENSLKCLGRNKFRKNKI